MIPEKEGIEWTEEHKLAWDIYERGENLVLIGPAGTGKTLLVQTIIEIEEADDPSNIIRCGSTGISAVTIGGMTVQGALGIIDTNMHPHDLYRRMKEEKKEVLRKAHIMVTDEVSMLSSEMIDLMDTLLRLIRKSDEPFGAMQMIILGDPLQLPPVVKMSGNFFNRDPEPYMMYHSTSWKDGNLNIVLLEKVFRQKERSFGNALLGIRQGVWNRNTLEIIRECMKSFEERGIQAPDNIPRLFSLKKQAEAENTRCIARLPGTGTVYRAKFTGVEAQKKVLQSGMRSPQVLCLKIGMRVMLTKNLNVKTGLANGVQGVVTGLEPTTVTVNFGAGVGVHMIQAAQWSIRSGESVATARQIPLIPAYAFTIHSVQGLSFEWMEVNLSRAWSLALLYVALSRARSKDRLLIHCEDLDRLTHLGMHENTRQFLWAAQKNTYDLLREREKQKEEMPLKKQKTEA